jgi:hypothetical protein
VNKLLAVGSIATTLLFAAGAAEAQSLKEYEGKLAGKLVGRIEIFQNDNVIAVAFADNRADGKAAVTRGAASWTVTGKWSACHHGEKASYCQLVGSSNVYRFAGSTMTVEERALTTTVLAATATGYVARVKKATGDVLIHKAGTIEKQIGTGTVAQAWSTGPEASWKIGSAALRIVSLATFEARDVGLKGLLTGNAEQNGTTSSPGDDYDCNETGTECVDMLGQSGCYKTNYTCTCKQGHSCSPFQYQSYSIYCPDPRVDEPLCGSGGCQAGAVAFDRDILSVTGLCDMAVFGFECDLGGKCFSLPPYSVPSALAPPDVQVTTTAVSFAGTSIPAGTSVTLFMRSTGEIYTAVP